MCASTVLPVAGRKRLFSSRWWPSVGSTGAVAGVQEAVDVREVVVFYEGREEWSEAVGRLVCMLSTATSPGCVFGVQGGRGVRRLRGYKGEWCT